MGQKLQNTAFIDTQNLRMGTTNDPNPWKIDLKKFRIFLTEKYQVKTACYFIGTHQAANENLYKFLKKSDYKVVFREHDPRATGQKKTNVDTDIVFMIMDHTYYKRKPGKIVLVSGDGDYKKVVSRLISTNKLRAILFPGKNWSSLYHKIDNKFKIKLYKRELRHSLQLKEYKK